jgi:hypothetical protein
MHFPMAEYIMFKKIILSISKGTSNNFSVEAKNLLTRQQP